MSTTSQRVYQRLPSAGKSVAASLRGLYLKSWRYGPETERLVEESLEREGWSPDRWRGWQEERLAYVLHRAITKVPYYRAQWAECCRRGDGSSSELCEDWPILEKEVVRENPNAFVADDCDVRQMFHEHTSGTSGTSLDLWWSRLTVRAWYALFEARWRRWYGLSRHDRWANLGGQLVTAVTQRQPPFWVWNRGLNQLYMSSYHLAPDFASHYLDALAHYKVDYLFGYSSSLYALAMDALRLKRSDLQMRVAITNAEPLFDYQRQAIAEAFQCPVRETYGMAEIVTAASECEFGKLHLWPEVGITEMRESCVEPGDLKTGELVCTGLLNADMPLIRYRLGDRATLSKATSGCACGRTLPLLSSIEGRIDDVLITADGRRVGRLDPIFKNRLPIREAQIIQDTLGSVRVLFVPAPGYTIASGQEVTDRIRERMGSVKVILEEVEHIARTPSGKFRSVICNLPSQTQTGAAPIAT